MSYGIGEIDEKKKRQVWMEDAKKCEMSLAMETARQILKEASELYPTKKKLWFASLKLEEAYGSVQSQARILKEAMEKSKHVLFILKYSKHLWKKLD